MVREGVLTQMIKGKLKLAAGITKTGAREVTEIAN
jgi:hypothetical protein